MVVEWSERKKHRTTCQKVIYILFGQCVVVAVAAAGAASSACKWHMRVVFSMLKIMMMMMMRAVHQFMGV